MEKELSSPITILKKNKVNKTEFKGIALDMFFGLIYLKKIHPQLGLPFKIREIISNYYNTFESTLFYYCSDIKKNKFDLHIPTGEQGLFDYIKSKKNIKRFYAIPVIVQWECQEEFEGHANILLIDLDNMKAERFEPYGGKFPRSHADKRHMNRLDDLFSTILNKYGLEYNSPKKFMPRLGPQEIEENNIDSVPNRLQQSVGNKEDEDDPGGFCGAWSIWFVDLRLSNPTINTDVLLENTLGELQNNTHSLRTFIRNYSQFLVDKRRQILKKVGVTDLNIKNLMYLQNYKTAISKEVKTLQSINSYN